MSADPIAYGVKKKKKMTTIKKASGNCVYDSDEWHTLLSEQCSQRHNEKYIVYVPYSSVGVAHTLLGPLITVTS